MNLLVTGAYAYTKETLEELKALGNNVIFMQQEKEPLPCEAAWVEGIIGNGIFLHHSIEQFVSLRYIQLTSAGFDRVPMDYVNAHGIKIFNARGVYSIPMAEFALCGVLDLYKQSRFFSDNQTKHRWEKHRGVLELSQKTVCIVGCGSVGTECAVRFSAFGCRVLGVDLFPYPSNQYESMVSLNKLDEILEISDIVVLTLPLTNETHHLMNETRLRHMKNGAVLVNIARGAVVDTPALLSALQDRLLGAVLDVFEEEPLRSDHPLWDMENVILTPHNSFVGDQNQTRLRLLVLQNLKQSEEKE